MATAPSSTGPVDPNAAVASAVSATSTLSVCAALSCPSRQALPCASSIPIICELRTASD